MSLVDRIDNDFCYHKPTPEMLPKFQDLRERGRLLAHLIEQTVPPGREQSTALTKLEEAIMWSNAGIARQGEKEKQDAN